MLVGNSHGDKNSVCWHQRRKPLCSKTTDVDTKTMLVCTPNQHLWALTPCSHAFLLSPLGLSPLGPSRLGVEQDVRMGHLAGAPEVVLEVLPAHAPSQVAHVHAPPANRRLKRRGVWALAASGTLSRPNTHIGVAGFSSVSSSKKYMNSLPSRQHEMPLMGGGGGGSRAGGGFFHPDP